MRILLIDGSAGLAGDMMLGALLDLGYPLEALEATVAALGVPASVVCTESSRGGIRGKKVTVEAPDDRGYRHLSDFLRVLDASNLPDEVQETATGIFRRIFEAEGWVHGKDPEKVHLHELGSLDTLVDIVGSVAGANHLRPDRVAGMPVNVGGGSVMTEHGRLQIPAPATARLLAGIPSFADDSGFERTTPTGAALAGLVDEFTGWPEMTLRRIGYGLGDADRSERPNALRMVMGEGALPAGASPLVVLEANLDDLVPEMAPHLLDRLLAAGARDAWFTPIQMKKGRPGLLVSALAPAESQAAVSGAFFEESTTLGVRHHPVSRETLERRTVRAPTPWGEVSMKLGYREGRLVNRAPEFEECRELASSAGVPLKEVYRHAQAAFPNEPDE